MIGAGLHRDGAVSGGLRRRLQRALAALRPLRARWHGGCADCSCPGLRWRDELGLAVIGAGLHWHGAALERAL